MLTIPDFKAQVIPIESNGWWGEHDESVDLPMRGANVYLYLCFYKVLADYDSNITYQIPTSVTGRSL